MEIAMRRIVIFEDFGYANLLPLTYWRATFELRCGCDQLIDKIRAAVGPAELSLMVRPDLVDVVAERWSLPANQPVNGETLFVNGRLLAASDVTWPDTPAVGMHGCDIVFLNADPEMAADLTADVWLDIERLTGCLEKHRSRHPQIDVDLPRYGMIAYPWHLVCGNGPELTRQWTAQPRPAVEGNVYAGAHLLNESDIHIGPSSKIKPCTVLDAEAGPIVIGRDVSISPHCTVEGPCYIGDGSLIQAGATIRAGTTIGPVCKVGGEIDNSIIHAHSNKQHDGFLGHAYLGEWINIAADCINSDLKNTYGEVTVPVNGVETPTGEMFVGMMMGDHSKAGINLSFATGSVVGFGCNVFVSHYPPKFVPSFSWYTDDGRDWYDARRGIDVARKVMARRNVELTAAEERLFLALPDITHRHERTDGHPE
jgi:UDP-N-acetylglucosamine diphosphorylase/glucosamine-1-phosphate N-acetyltransferase